MIQRFIQDEDGSMALEVDEEGIKYFVQRLIVLYSGEVGDFLTVSAVWTAPAPWWRVWDRSRDPLSGQFRLRKVDSSREKHGV